MGGPVSHRDPALFYFPLRVNFNDITMLSNRLRLWPAILSGLLAGATTFANDSFPFLHWSVFFCLVPLWTAWGKQAEPAAIFFSGWIFQILLGLTGFHWIAHTITEFSHLGPFLAFLLLLLYSALANLHFVIAGLIWHFVFRRGALPPAAKWLALAFVTAACECWIPMLFHWNLGYSWLFMRWPGYQTAEWFGFRGLSTLTILINAPLALAWENRRARPLAWISPATFALGLFAATNLCGWLIARHLPSPDRIAKVLIVQPRVENMEKEKLEREPDKYRAELFARHVRLTDKALTFLSRPVDFVMWPENAFPDFIADPFLTFRLGQQLHDYLQARRINLLTGGYGVTAKLKVTNSLFALGQDGRWASFPYEKRVLLPFGEYIPGAETFPALKKWLPDVRDYARGEKALLLDLAGIRLGPQICYEGLFDSLARELAGLGAQIFANVTNDSWYGNSQEPWQHLYITAAKAVEFRRPLLRATNSGLSTAVLATGEFLDISPLDREWFHLFELPYYARPRETVFLRWGYRVDGLFLLLGLILLFFWNKRRPGTVSPA
jgi:apolipoprotein N-acyltransferase